jgi:long-chain-fatty-acid--[acyl-carrier-protein] ligase
MANVLATALTRSLTASDRDLVLLADKQWSRHPWQEIHTRALNVAERLRTDGIDRIGLVGAPTAEFVATVIGAFYAGSAVSVLPGPIRGADVAQWAQATRPGSGVSRCS